jgi:hypothetical protein
MFESKVEFSYESDDNNVNISGIDGSDLDDIMDNFRNFLITIGYDFVRCDSCYQNMLLEYMEKRDMEVEIDLPEEIEEKTQAMLNILWEFLSDDRIPDEVKEDYLEEIEAYEHRFGGDEDEDI